MLSVGGESVHVAPLTLGIDGVEGKRGLSAPAEAGDNHELSSGNIQTDILEIVSLGSPDLDIFLFRHPRKNPPYSALEIRYSAICTALRAAPFLIWSLTSQKARPLGFDRSLRILPTKTSSQFSWKRGIG